MVRFGARDMDPLVGRWVSKDPIGFDGGQANLYVYVGNDGINGIDAPGTGPIACGAAIVGCLGIEVWNAVDTYFAVKDCEQKVEDAKRELDACGTSPADIKKHRDLLQRVEADCIMEHVKGYGLGFGVGAACAKLIASACLAPSP